MQTENLFSQRTRQSPAAIVFILGGIFKFLLRQFWIFILIFLFNPKKKTAFGGLSFMLLGLAAFGAVSSIISYFNHYFYVRDGELVMEKGVLRKVKLAVPLDRIQSVNFKQGILHQALKVVSVEIDTAGSQGREFSLQALEREKAEALRDYVENYKSIARQEAAALSPQTAETAENQELETEEIARPETATLLFRLSPLDLVKIGVGQNHVRTALIMLAFFVGFLDDVEEALDMDFSQKLQEMLGMGMEKTLLFNLLLAIPFFLILSFLLTLVNTVLRHFDLRFWRTERGFKMVGGLFTRQEVSANLLKIQFLRWTSSPLMRAFKMVAVRLPQAASVEVSRKMSVAVPGCYEAHLQAIRQAWFPEENSLPHEEHGVDKAIVRRQFFFNGILPIIVLTGLTFNMLGSAIWILLLWLPLAWWTSVRFHRNWRWFVSEEGLRLSWGVFNQKQALLQWYKVQAVSVRQSPFFRRAGLANLTLHTAAGAVNVPFIPMEKAVAVRDFVLFKVETGKRKWM